MSSYGYVRDDGTVQSCRSSDEAEGRGGLESVVVRARDGRGWVYPATGRDFKPEDVQGLSPATASRQARTALENQGLGGLLADNGIVSDNVSGRDAVVTRVQVQKSLVQPDWRDRAEEVLAELPGAMRTVIERDDPMYNYWFLSVVRRKST